ncbi:type III secretion protein HrpB4 [Caldimonas mangrovi]|nr:type III secretion protein HrpB4 [Caldimonas mangrovi]
MASLALGLQRKLFDMPLHAHTSWAQVIDARWPFLGELSDRPGVAALRAELLVAQGGGLPAATDLGAAEVQLALQGREQVVRSLARLALARRPGVLRCAVERDARQALRSVLGELYPAVMAHSGRGRPVPYEVLRWTEMHWACVGYHDWTTLLRPQDSLWRRMVRLSLPRGLLGMRARRRLAPADLKVRQAIQLLSDAERAWPC